jgi:hypothetical protein
VLGITVLAVMISLENTQSLFANKLEQSNVLRWTQARTRTGCTYKYPARWKLTTWVDETTGAERVNIRENLGNRLPFGLSTQYDLYISPRQKTEKSGEALFLPKVGSNGDGYTSVHWSSKAASSDFEQILVIGSQTPDTITVNAPTMSVTRYQLDIKTEFGMQTGLDVRSYLLMKHLGWDYGVRVAEPEFFKIFDSIDCKSVSFK